MQSPEKVRDQRETTFILITSELTNPQISEIKNKILDSNLEITKEVTVELNAEKIQKIWPEIINKSTKRLTFKVLSNRKLLLLLVRGREAISKVLILKKESRKLFLKVDDGFNRIMHCPDTSKDVRRELLIIM